MAISTLANKSPGSVFNFGDILDRITGVGINALETVAPVWLADQLNINQQIPVADNPTYQNTDSQRQPAGGMTTNEGNRNNTEFTINQSTVLLVGVGLLGVLLFVRQA